MPQIHIVKQDAPLKASLPFRSVSCKPFCMRNKPLRFALSNQLIFNFLLAIWALGPKRTCMCEESIFRIIWASAWWSEKLNN